MGNDKFIALIERIEYLDKQIKIFHDSVIKLQIDVKYLKYGLAAIFTLLTGLYFK